MHSDWKQRERAQKIATLPPIYREALTASDITILDTPIASLVERVSSGTWDPVDILHSYGKKTLQAHETTNCLTEIMISEAEQWARTTNRFGPLAGVPVSLKDTVSVKGYDSCIGYSSWTGKPKENESAIVRLLRDAGAVPFVKTTIPITLLSFESQSAVFGVTKNPHVLTHTPGGSSGGEAALLAMGGSRVGIGSDVAGSVRVPAHFSGVYTIRSSTGRFPRTGGGTSVPGQEGVPPVYSPMAKTLEDLHYIWRAIVGMHPWEYDHSCHPIPWRTIELQDKKLTWGVIWDDGVVRPSPACERALRIVVKALRENGHHVRDFEPPSPYEGLQLASQLLLSDGGETFRRPFQFLEPNDPGVDILLRITGLPTIFRKIYAWYLRYIRRDPIAAGLVFGLSRKTTAEHFALVTKREEYRARFHKEWNKEGFDFLLTVPNATPALPLGGMRNSIGSVGYSFLFNLLDYTAGVMPVCKVDAALDGLSPAFKGSLRRQSLVAQNAYRNYDAEAMQGLPVGIQIVGRRLEEEKVLEGMKLVESTLAVIGKEYKGLSL